MIKIGLTGGIGSGKSIVCNIFKQLGVPVYNADIRAKIISDKDEDIKQDLIKLFGNRVYNESGLERNMLAGIIFNNKELREKVNAIIHPKVVRDYTQWLKLHEESKYTVHEAAILFESGMRHLFDKIIMVTAPEKLRIKRVVQRDDVAENHVRNIINSQLPEQEITKLSDYIIVNDDKEPVLPQVLTIHNELLSG